MGFQTEKFSLTTLVYDDSQMSGVLLRDVGVNIPTIEQINSTSLWAPNFDAIGDKIVFSFQFPHKMAEEATVTVVPHLHWMSSSDSANVVRWQLEYQWLNIGDDLGSDTTITVDGTPDAYNFQILGFGNRTKSGALISSFFTGTLTRITNGATDYTGEVYLLGFDIHFKIDTLGSNNESSKTYPS